MFFWFILLAEFALQQYFVYLADTELGSALLGMAPLTFYQ